jgi:hypothetical protein
MPSIDLSTLPVHLSCVCGHMHVSVYVYVHVCVRGREHAFTLSVWGIHWATTHAEHRYFYPFFHVCACVCVCVCTAVCCYLVTVCMHVHVNILSHTHSHTHTHTDTCRYLKELYSPDEIKNGNSLAVHSGDDGARLTHDHKMQYHYILQSLTLWRDLLDEMYMLWYVAHTKTHTHIALCL